MSLEFRYAHIFRKSDDTYDGEVAVKGFAGDYTLPLTAEECSKIVDIITRTSIKDRLTAEENK